MAQRRQLDWVVRPEAWGVGLEFFGSATTLAFLPLTVWGSSMSSAGASPPQMSGLFEPGAALTVERVKGYIFVIVEDVGERIPRLYYQTTMRLRVGEAELDGGLEVDPPVQPTSYDVNSPLWANEDLLWEDRHVFTPALVGTSGTDSQFFQPAVNKFAVDVKTRRRLEPPDQLQLVVQRDLTEVPLPPEPVATTVVFANLRVLLSSAM